MSRRSDMSEWNAPHNKRSLKGASMKDLSRRKMRRRLRWLARAMQRWYA